jgi:hypothetical protein
MRRYFGTLVLSAALVSPMFFSGCAARIYDYEGHDYHRWNGHERVYYEQWEVDTRRGRMDYDRRSQAEQRDYWKWRDERYGDHHHDHDHGREH